MTKILSKLSLFTFTHRKKVFFSWIVLISISICIIAFNKNINIESDLDGLKHTEAYKVKKNLEENYNIKLGNSAAVVIEHRTINTKDLEQSIKNKFKEVKSVINVQGDLHNTQILYIEFKSDYKISNLQALTPDIRGLLRLWERNNKTKTYLTGITAFQYDSRHSSFNESKKSEIISLIMCFIILIFTFGSLFLSILPIITGFSTILFFTAFINIFSLTTNPISQILTSLLGLALGIDYSLLISSRFKEEFDKRKSEFDKGDKSILKEIYLLSIIPSSKTIFYSGLIMLLSIVILFIPDVSLTKTVVINLLIMIIISILSCIIFLPAFLSIFYKYLDKPQLLTNIVKGFDKYNFWRSFTLHILKYPKMYFIASIAFLIIFTIPIFNIKLWSPVITIAPKNSESIEGYKLFQKDGWGGKILPVNIIVESDNGLYNSEYISYIYDLSKFILKDQNVESIQSITSWDKSFTKNEYIEFYNSLYVSNLLFNSNNILPLVSKDGKSTLINISPKDLIDLEQSYKIIDSIQKYRSENNRFEVSIGGIVARTRDFTKELYSYIPEMLVFIIISIYIVLYFYLKSIILPIKAGLMNFLPILSSFGIVALIFQYGYMKDFFNISFNGAVTNIVPLILFCLVFGLSMDYEIFILSRINEVYEITGDVKESVIEGMSRSSSLITGAAMILEAVFIPGIFSSNPQIQEICIGISAAIFIDATIVRLFLVPSFIYLMGSLNWWNPFRNKKID